MFLSKLQKYILTTVFLSHKKKYNRENLIDFYERFSVKTKKTNQRKNITQSLERLIGRDLLISYGEKTKYKWYIKEIRLTARGRKTARKFLAKQQKLPFKK